MSAPLKPWENTVLQNNANVLRSTSPAIPQANSTPRRSVPTLPPRPLQNSYGLNNYGSSLSPYSGLGGYGYGSYNSLPYRSSLYSSPYNSYGSYGAYGGYGGSYGSYGGNFGTRDIAEERFIQFAEERSRSTFANVENIVRAFSSISMMLDNTFFAMTSSFRAVLSVAENFGRLRSVFGQIWYSINLFRLLNWLYRKLKSLMGFKSIRNTKSLAWSEAASASGAVDLLPAGSGGSNWPTFAFLGVILSAPYFISKLLPKYEDKCDPEKWKSSAIRAKAAFDFVATSSNELTINTNDEILLAPKHIQEEMKLTNTGWGYAFCNGRTGAVPLNYILVMKRVNRNPNTSITIDPDKELPIPRVAVAPKGNGKRVSFGETQFFESVEPVNVQQQEEESKEAQVNEDVNTSEGVNINVSAIADSNKKIDDPLDSISET